MSYDFKGVKQKMDAVAAWLEKELASIHTGRASVALLDSVAIEMYGARTPIPHAATVTAEDARTLRITPWDKQNAKQIETAINAANLGVSVSADGAGLRVFFPELTTERRTAFVKIARGRLEEARVSVRGERESAWGDIQRAEKDGVLSEDEKFAAKDALQKIVDDTNTRLAALAEKKEREIMS